MEDNLNSYFKLKALSSLSAKLGMEYASYQRRGCELEACQCHKKSNIG